MAKNAFNEILRFPKAGQELTAGTPQYSNILESSEYIVPQNKRLVFRLFIPHKTSKMILGCIATALSQSYSQMDTDVKLANFFYIINGLTKISVDLLGDDNVHYASKEILSDIVSPILIAKPGTVIKFKIAPSEPIIHDDADMNGGGLPLIPLNSITYIPNAMFINGFLEDDI